MINIAIIEDNPNYRRTVKIILELEAEFLLLHTLEDSKNMNACFKEAQPDVILMDIDLPGKSGIETVWEIKKAWPEIKVLMLTVFEETEKIFGAIKAGANGYLLKKDPPDRIMHAIFSLLNGEASMNGIIAAKVMEYFKQLADAEPTLEEYHLTEREKEILYKLMEGLGYKQIASHCGIARETLNTHMKSIYRKLNVHSRAEVAARFGTHLKK